MFEMNNNLIRKDILFILISLAIFFLSQSVDLYVLSVLILVENVYLLWRHRKNVMMLIICAFIFWSNYSIVVANVISPIDDYFTGFRNTRYMPVAIHILVMFNTLLLFLWKDVKPIQHYVPFLYDTMRKENPIISWGCIPLLLVIFVLGFSNRELGERSDPSALYEYSSVIFIMAFSYSKYKIQRILLIIILIAFALQNLVFGGRVTAVQLLLLCFLVFMKKDVNIMKWIPYIILGIFLMSAIGGLRGSIANSGGNVLEHGYNSLMKSKLTLDTAYSAFYTSVSFVIVKISTPFDQQMYLLWQFVKSIFLGGSVEDSVLAAYTHEYVPHQYGGILPFFAYFYLGSFGIILLSVYLKFLARKTISVPRSRFWRCYALFFVATVPRWYLYSPSPILRGLFLFSIVYFVCWWFNKLFVNHA